MLKRRLHRLVWVYTCQNVTLLEITWYGSSTLLYSEQPKLFFSLVGLWNWFLTLVLLLFSSKLGVNEILGSSWMEYKNLSWVWGWNRKNGHKDHHLASRGSPRDDKRRSQGTDFSIPYLHKWWSHLSCTPLNSVFLFKINPLEVYLN